MEPLNLAAHITRALENAGYTQLYVEELTLKAGYCLSDSRVLVRKGLTDTIYEALAALERTGFFDDLCRMRGGH